MHYMLVSMSHFLNQLRTNFEMLHSNVELEIITVC